MSNGRYERELVNKLHDENYHVMRAPSSGGGTTRELPDVFYGKAGVTPIAAELKTTSDDKAYYTHGEVKSLVGFATAFGADARLVARFKGDTTFYEVAPEDAHRTPEDNYRVTKDTPHETR